MSQVAPIGISDISIYLPKLRINLETIVKKRVSENGNSKIEKVLWRTLKCTGTLSMRFPELWEDSVTMAAEAAAKIFKKNPHFNIQALRYLAVGTETTVDHSKPIAAYVSGILKKSGINIPQSISTFQTQHACAGGTIALLGILAMLSICGPSEESGIVMCSDIARYARGSSAEMTQGAGAVAIHAEANPKLVTFDLPTVGYSSKDVDDFFRPLGSDSARVKGTYSIRCYMEALQSAFLNHCERSKETPEQVLKNTDFYAFHVPYPKLPQEAMEKILSKHLNLDKEGAEAYFKEKGFYEMVKPASKSGNIYSGSMFMSLAFILHDRWKKFGDDIVGKQILMASYGSGNTMMVIRGTIPKEAPSILKTWNLDRLWNEEESASIDQYERWATSNGTSPEAYAEKLESELSRIGSKSFYLQRIREDGYREYFYRE